MDHVGEQLAEHSEDGFDTQLIDCAFTTGVAALANHKSEPKANARYVFDEDRNKHTFAAFKPIHSEEKIFCYYGPNYQLHVVFAGEHDTLPGHRPPPKWYR